MDWRGGLSLGGKLGRALGRIAADRVLELGDAALPRTEHQIASADAIDALLREGGNTTLPPIAKVQLPGRRFESSNCQNFLVEIDWEGASSSALPKTLYVKLPSAELGTRAFANAVGFWSVECAFAKRLAPHVPIRVPRVYAVAERGARFVLLLENLHEEPGTRLFTNRDMAAGTDVARARMCLETFAELHAAFWDTGERRRETLLPLGLHPYLSPGGRRRTAAMAAAAIAPAQRAAPDLFRDSHVALCRRALAKWDPLVDAWYEGPLTLIHGDSHLANCFEYEHAQGPRMGMIDFQGTHWCHGIRDLQYFLIDSMEPEALAHHESNLIEAYVDALSRHGVTLDPADARERYRSYAFQTLMVAVVSIGLGGLTERDTTLRTVLARSVAAVERLDFDGWLARL